MSLRKSIVCLLHFMLALLFIVPLACAAVAERALPEPSTSTSVSAQRQSPESGYGMIAGSSGVNPTIEDVWMQHGGARQYYSAQYSARQQYMGGASRIDPACLPLLPPMKVWGAPVNKKYTKVRKPVQTANPCPETDKKTGAYQGGGAAMSPQASTTPEAVAAAKKSAASAANAADATASTTKAPNGKGTPVPLAPLKVTTPKAEGPQAAIAEKPPLH